MSTNERHFIVKVTYDPSAKMGYDTFTVEGHVPLEKTVASYQRDSRTVRIDVYERTNSLVRTVSWTDTNSNTPS
jgi:hypothetical protein